MSEWAWLTLLAWLALGFQLQAGAIGTTSSDITMPFSMTETMLSLQTVTVSLTLQSCDEAARLGPDCSSSENFGLSTSILTQSSPTLTLPLPIGMGSGSGIDQSLSPSPTPVSLPSTFIPTPSASPPTATPPTATPPTATPPTATPPTATPPTATPPTATPPTATPPTATHPTATPPTATPPTATPPTATPPTATPPTATPPTATPPTATPPTATPPTATPPTATPPTATPPTPTPPTPTPPSYLPWWNWLIIGISGAIASSACLLLCFACYCCYLGLYRKTKRGKKEHLLGGEEPDGEAVEMGWIQEREQRVKKVSRISFRSRAQVRSRPLTVEELQISLMNPAALYAEYESIPSNMVTMAEVPPGAEEKNRYKDVLPNAPTRVSLFLKFGVANSDYINANFIRGYHDTSKVYIATQGPLYWTAADFWRMVWEQRSSAIVMVTILEEKGLVKCARYWPDTTMTQSTVYEDLEVVIRSRTTTQVFTTTTFLLRHREKMVSREVVHFLFRSWPDHGVPLTTRPVIDFLLHARKHMRDMPGPTVVHCSAGIGRTGVFIGADIGMQQLEETGEVDVLRIVSVMRQDRGGMVQTKEQYLFLHQVLLDYSHYLDQLKNPYLYHHHRQRLQTTQEEEEEEEEEEEIESGVASGDSQTALTLIAYHPKEY